MSRLGPVWKAIEGAVNDLAGPSFSEGVQALDQTPEEPSLPPRGPEAPAGNPGTGGGGGTFGETIQAHGGTSRKVGPLIGFLEPYDAWVSGIRREQSPSRASARKAERSERYGVWKVQPLADWSEKDVWQYILRNDIPYNPLHDVGYRSIGCIPCTRPTRPDEEERAGRWAGSDKLECGIHVESKDTLRRTV